jgi:Kinase binding protein CGI-121
MLETIHLAHIPPHLPIYITLYHSLQNAAFLRQQLLAGNSDFEYAFIDASMVQRNQSPFMLQIINTAQVDPITNPYFCCLFPRSE